MTTECRTRLNCKCKVKGRINREKEEGGREIEEKTFQLNISPPFCFAFHLNRKIKLMRNNVRRKEVERTRATSTTTTALTMTTTAMSYSGESRVKERKANNGIMVIIYFIWGSCFVSKQE